MRVQNSRKGVGPQFSYLTRELNCLARVSFGVGRPCWMNQCATESEGGDVTILRRAESGDRTALDYRVAGLEDFAVRAVMDAELCLWATSHDVGILSEVLRPVWF